MASTSGFAGLTSGLRRHKAADSGPVRATADDAAQCKASAVERGYFKDPFIGCFVDRPRRRSPLIHRGYFVRVACLDRTVRAFVEAAGPSSQVVNLGGGVDSTFWRLAATGCNPRKFVELDLPAVTRRKARCIAAAPLLKAALASSTGEEATQVDHGEGNGVSVTAAAYALCPCDIGDPAAVDAALTSAGIDRSLPTLFLSECVLIYLRPERSDGLLAWISGAFPAAAVAIYEQILPHDAFGAVMVRNLADRGLALRSFEAYPDCTAQAKRLLAAGFHRCTVANMLGAAEALVPRPAMVAAARAEPLDEVEEWSIMQSHYCLALAVKEPDAAGAELGGRGGGAAGRAPEEAGGRAGAASEAGVPAGEGQGRVVGRRGWAEGRRADAPAAGGVIAAAVLMREEAMAGGSGGPGGAAGLVGGVVPAANPAAASNE
ncbi:hypothetical protein FNF29_03520 [Cafeteria roenbergensis]|uniref:[phosphatase 2A protein]-leucine-carboxy methyltransferase n=1 Tax=Cafeteria roenbergensis TaxID=33653 RepID=A0A5A8DBM2_CAFRO|nr:hypothetical protein FNF29_03520 [Cafeteria roenbergensis]KAA0160301.1 hypothetical protein FNF28_05497 [Cafeteria roenbergensis]KAA0161311.1 hypothetical protein FNF31_03925 [Cafeteria roenbergensis]|eukprot:KAA0153000.1 hypothetical protein FNF29_03520 [Cafeteria roenbergensis]